MNNPPLSKKHFRHIAAAVALLLLTLGPSVIPASAAPIDQLQLKEGELRKVFFGVGAIMVRIEKVGTDGWVLISIAEEAQGVQLHRGEKHWLNASQIWMISAPFTPPPGPR